MLSDHRDTSSTTSLQSWVDSVNTANGLYVVKDMKYDDLNDNASTISSDLSTLDETSLDLCDMTDDESDDDISDSLTTVTYMSDFTVFLDDNDEEDTLTTVTSLSNFTIFLEDSDDEDTATTVSSSSSSLSSKNMDGSEDFLFNISDIVHSILDEMIALAV